MTVVYCWLAASPFVAILWGRLVKKRTIGGFVMSNGVDFRKLALGLRTELNAAQSELSALRAEVEELHSATSAAMFDTLTSELAALREKLAVAEQRVGMWKETSKKMFQSKMAVYTRLTAAEQRNDESLNKVTELNGLLLFLRQRYAIRLDSTDLEAIDAALKPTESGASE